MTVPMGSTAGYVTSPASTEEEVYKGGAITAIRDLAEKLGAQVDYDPATARVTVNGKVVPYSSLQQGRSFGSVHDIAGAAGAKVEQLPDGSYRVVRKVQAAAPSQAPGATAPPASTGTPVTGNTSGAMYTGDPTVMANGQPQPSPQPVQGQAAPLSVFMGAAGPGRNASDAQFGQALADAGVPVQDAVTIAQNRNGGLGGTPAPAPNGQPGADAMTGMAPIDYNELARRAAMEAELAYAPQVQRLRDIASRYQQQYGFDASEVQGGLERDIANLRAGEVAREGRINENMNQRGSAIYNSGIRFAALRDQQVNAYNKELGLTQKASDKLSRLANSLNLRLQDLASQENMLMARQGDKAILSLKALADKSESQAFKMREVAWRMYVDQSKLQMQERQQANTLWLGVQRIKSQERRAAAEDQLRRDIANGNLDVAWARVMGEDEYGLPTVEGRRLSLQEAESLSKQTGYVYGLDGKPAVGKDGKPFRTLPGAKFDFEERKFKVQQDWKEYYEDELLRLREAGLLNDKEYKDAMVDLQNDRLDLDERRLEELSRHNKASEANASNQARTTYRTKFGIEAADLLIAADEAEKRGDMETASSLWAEAASKADAYMKSGKSKDSSSWKGFMSDVSRLEQQALYNAALKKNMPAAIDALVKKWVPEMDEDEAEALEAYLTARGWLP